MIIIFLNHMLILNQKYYETNEFFIIYKKILIRNQNKNTIIENYFNHHIKLHYDLFFIYHL